MPRYLPDDVSKNLPAREREVGEQMHAGAVASAEEHDCDIYCYPNLTEHYRDNRDEGTLFVPKDPLALNPFDDFGIAEKFDTETGLVNIVYNGPRYEDMLYPQSLEPKTDHTICPSCVAIFDYWCQTQGDKSGTEYVSGAAVPNSVVHHFNVASLIASAGILECTVCKMIHKTVRLLYPGMLENVQAARAYRMEVCWNRRYRMTTEQKHTLHFVLYQPAKPKHYMLNHHPILNIHLWPMVAFSHCFEPRLAPDMDSMAQKRGLARRWLSHCVANDDGQHDLCNISAEHDLPNRVLDVVHAKASGFLKLVSRTAVSIRASDSDLRFCTLSYRWGSDGASQQPLLKQDNLLSMFDRGLRMSDLPATFRGAVEVCSWFDVPYLWIDALCIIQDDHEDWLREASIMSNTYRNAWLNLSSDAGESSHYDLFTEIDHLKTSWPEFESIKTHQRWTLTPTPVHITRQIHVEPTASRAWVYRERQLSRRILHFTTRGLAWECCKQGGPSYASESFPGGVPFEHFRQETNIKFQVGRFEKALLPNDEETYATWNDVCKNLSCRLLTVESDRAMVLAGIAEDFGHLLPNDEYVAGLWRSTLPYSLLWHVPASVPRDPFYFQASGPSWSWLSRNHSEVVLANRARVGEHAIAVDLLSISTSLRTPTLPYGPTESGEVEIRGLLRRVRFSGCTGRRDPNDVAIVEVSVLDKDEESDSEKATNPDEEEEEESNGEKATDPGEKEEWDGENAADPGEEEESDGENAADPGEEEESDGENAADPGEEEESDGEHAADTSEEEEWHDENVADNGYWRVIGESYSAEEGALCDIWLDYPDLLGLFASFECFALMVVIDQLKSSIGASRRMIDCLLLLPVGQQCFRRVGRMRLDDEFALKMRYRPHHSVRGYPECFNGPQWRIAEFQNEIIEEHKKRQHGGTDSSPVRHLTGVDALYQYDQAVDEHCPWVRRLEPQHVVII